MTGRRLYDLHCDAIASKTSRWQRQQGYVTGCEDDTSPAAWPFLSDADRSVWNALARRITPKKRVARA